MVCRKFLLACEQALEQHEEFETLSQSLSEETVETWEASASNWEKDHTEHDDPYVRKFNGRSLTDSVRTHAD